MQSNVQRVASELGIAIVCPDTSPRGLDIEGEADVYSFGVGTLVCPTRCDGTLSPPQAKP